MDSSGRNQDGTSTELGDRVKGNIKNGTVVCSLYDYKDDVS